MNSPTSGQIEIDDQDIWYPDSGCMKQHVAGISQDCTLYDGSVHENTAIGLVNREDVIEAYSAALMHEFVPVDYYTVLGTRVLRSVGGRGSGWPLPEPISAMRPS
jgi:ABC-type multidrug transport system fused ATPase/permease subunit